MEPPPLAHDPTTTPAATAAATATTITTTQLNYPDSANSSPRSRQAETCDDHLPPVASAKLRLMCSYGGHIIPRPNDKALCYVGGDTRIVAVDRHSSLAELSSRLSRTLLNGRNFSLKYQLPNEDLDSLVSVATDEDSENMIEEYVRTISASPLKSSRLRLFLFPSKPEASISMRPLLDDAKSETWFVDALNSTGFLPRGQPDSAGIDNLLELDGMVRSDSCTDVEVQNEPLIGNKHAKNEPDVHSTMPDSPMVETNSSFGSTSSSPSMSNLPPIKVRVDDGGARLQNQMVGLDEQFSQMGVATHLQKQDDGGIMLSTPPPLPTVIRASPAIPAAVVNSAAASGDHPSRVFSDDDRSDQVAPNGLRKPPLPLQPVQRKFGDVYNQPSPDSKHPGSCNLSSPDSVASDCSIASAAALSKHTFYQDPTHVATRESKAPPSPIDPKVTVPDSSPQVQTHQVQDYVYNCILPQQNQQQQTQYVYASTHCVNQPATGPVPMSSYYPMYATLSQQQALHQPMDQQCPIYLFPVTQNQPYNMKLQANIADATAVASSRALMPPNAAIVTSSAAYKETIPSTYPTRNTSLIKPEMAANVYRTAATATPTIMQVSSSRYQQQYVGLSQMSPPSESTTAGPAVTANCTFKYAHPTQDYSYYLQHQGTPTFPQYQSMTPAAAALLSQGASPIQLPEDNITSR